MFKKPPTKAELRAELEAQVRDYMDHGGHIEKVPSGVSGWGEKPGKAKVNTPLFNEPRETRTYVTEVVANIDARKVTKEKKRKPVKKSTAPKLKTIYDDFGEPVRRVWVDE